MLKTKHILKKLETPEPVTASFKYNIHKIDVDKRLVTGVVYSPWILDTHGHYMSPDEVEKTAHAFLRKGLQNQIDIMHDNVVIDAVIVESYIERIGNEEVPVGSWVATSKINDPSSWKEIKRGSLNGYSMEVSTYMIEHETEIEFGAWSLGETKPDPYDGHTHFFLIKMDDEGNVAHGKTSKGGSDGHVHTITQLSVTDPYEQRTHRIVV